MKTVLLFIALLVTSYGFFLGFKTPRWDINPNYAICGPANPDLSVTSLTFSTPPALGQNSTVLISGTAINNGFMLGSYSLNLTTAGQSVLTDGGSFNQTQYAAGDAYNFSYVLSLNNFIPQGSYQMILQLNQPETYPNYEIICLNISFSAF